MGNTATATTDKVHGMCAYVQVFVYTCVVSGEFCPLLNSKNASSRFGAGTN